MTAVYSHPRAAGHVAAPPSKSEAGRALVCAALADMPTDIYMPSSCLDTDAVIGCLRSLGARIDDTGSGCRVTPIASLPLALCADCGESAMTLRFILPLAAALGINADFTLSPSLAARPEDELIRALNDAGTTVFSDTTDRASSLSCRGALRVTDITVDGSRSSQFVSGLLIALTLTGGSLHVSGSQVSRPYIALTVGVLSRFGAEITRNGDMFTVLRTHPLLSPGIFRVGGDWSGAAFCLIAGLIGDTPVSVSGLDVASLQGDSAVVAILRRMGGSITVGVDRNGNGNTVTASPSRLTAININCADIPDLVPPLAVAAACADGVTRLSGASHLKIKESNRISSLCRLITSLGGRADALADGIAITGCGRNNLHGGECDACGDHRIAMAAATLSLACRGNVVLHGGECVLKSYPGFGDFIGSQK